MTCNIDRTGRRIRAVTGALLVLAVVVWFGLAPSAPWGIQALRVLLTLGGAFTVFEGLVGWCAIRAMGVKTPF